MDYLIAPTLFQNKTCRLPGIGTLSVVTHAAETDFVNTQIKAPVPSISFAASQDDENIFNEFTALSELIKKDLDEKGTVILKGVGEFIKHGDGSIHFVPLGINHLFTQPVLAERIIREDKEHTILVGDKETTTKVMSGFFVEEKAAAPTDKWWIWAIVLAVIAVTIIAGYIYSQEGNNSLGNAVKELF